MRLFLFLFIFSIVVNASNSKQDMEKLELMYNSFVFSKDLKHAYEVAQKALKHEPTSLKWHQKMAQVSLWLSKTNESMDHSIYVYNRTNDLALEKKLIDQMLATYQYEKAVPLAHKKSLRDGKEKSVNSMIDLYDKVGRPKKSISVLKKLYKQNPSPKYLSDMLFIYLQTGEIDKSKAIVKELIKHNNISIKSALSLSKYFFLQKDLTKAYKVLKFAKVNATPKDIEYFKKLSDIGWYLDKKRGAVYGSLMLYRYDKARMVDYERIGRMLKKSKTKVLKNVALKALKQHKNTALFLKYAYQTLDQKKYNELDKVLHQELLGYKNRKLLHNLEDFWLIKADVNAHFKRTKQSTKDLEFAKRLASNSPRVFEKILWQHIDGYDYESLKREINYVETRENLQIHLAQPLAVGQLMLQRPDKAYKYLKIVREDTPQDIELDFLESEILNAQGRVGKRKKLLRSIIDSLTKQAEQNPQLYKDKKFVKHYIRASLPILNEQDASELINTSKSILDLKEYNEIELLYALQFKRYDMAETVIQKVSRKDPVAAIEISHFTGNEQQKYILMQEHTLATPYELRILEAQNYDDIDRAISLAKEAISYNKHSRFLKDTLSSLYNKYGNRFSIGYEHTKQNKTGVDGIELENFFYIGTGFGLTTGVQYYKYNDDSNNTQQNINNKEDTSAKITLKKQFDTGEIEAGVKIRDNKNNRLGVILRAEKYFKNNLSLGASIITNDRAEDQSIQMEAEGKSDRYMFEAGYSPFANHQIYYMNEYSQYSKNGKEIGNGLRTNLEWHYNFGENLNYGLRAVYENGKYDEKNKITPRVAINPLLTQTPQEKLLSNDFTNVGLGFSYGGINNSYFGTDFQPYLDLSIIQSSENYIFTNIYMGFMHSLSDKDNYSLLMHYQDGKHVYNQEEFGVNLNYSISY